MSVASFVTCLPPPAISIMQYTVTPFYIDTAEIEHPWGEAFVIDAVYLLDHQVSADKILDRMLAAGRSDNGHPLGMHIADADGEVVFTFIRPAGWKSTHPD